MKNEPLRIISGLLLFVAALVLDFLKLPVAPLVFYIAALIVSGIGVFLDAVRGILRLDLLDEKFLMSAASVGAMIIGEPAEGVAGMLFFLVGEYFEHRATKRARGSIRALMEICPDTARVLADGVESVEDAEDVPVGSVIVIRPGERVPIDAVVISGAAELDTSALTGEAVPRPVTVGDTIDSGVVVLGGVLSARTLRVAEESRAARVLSLVEDATERKSREESFITVFSRYYTPIVMVLAVIMATVPPLFSLISWESAVYRALSFLVVSCPCALVISVPMAFFGGIGGAASRGILYKGGNVFSAVASARCVVFDKTGTLTTGEFSISEVKSVGITEGELLRLVAAAEYGSNHPIAVCLKAAYPNPPKADSLTDVVGKGIVAVIEGKSVAVGNSLLMKEVGAVVTDAQERAVLVAVDGAYSGYISLADRVKPEAKAVLSDLGALGVRHTALLSGDGKESVLAVGDALGIDEVHYGLLPEDKYSHLERIISENKGSTIYVGDGINDAPCLARADVGVAMGERGTDSAIESADLVIMADNLGRIPDAVRIARKTVRIAKENIIFAIGIKAAVLLLVALNLAGMWLAVFADVGVAVLAILNSMRTMMGKKQQ